MWVFVGESLSSRICLLGLIGLSSIALGQSVTLSLGSGQGIAGGSVVLPITITSTGAQAAGVQWQFTYSADITGIVVTLGSSGVSSQKSLECNGNLCLISGLSGTIIPDGTVAIATFQIAANPSAQMIPIQITGAGASTAAANPIPASGISGSITVSVVVQPALSGLVCTIITLNTPGSTSCTVSLNSAALAGGYAVPVSSNNTNLIVPASVTVPAGQSSVSFNATAAQVSLDQAATLTVGSGSAVRTVTLTLVAPVQLTGAACSPTSLSSGASSTCTVSLNKITPVPAVVAVGSNNAIVSVPGNVTVPAGQSTANFQARVGNVASSQNAIITASFNGVNRTATLSLNVPPVPTAVSVSPSASAGSTQIFTFIFSDSQSAANLSTLAFLFAPSEAYPNSCFSVLDRNLGTVQLEWDNVTGADLKPIGSALTLQNSQCMIGATTVTASGLSVTITMAVTFKSAFGGLKNIYMYGADNSGAINTGWVQRGNYTATISAPVPSVVSVSPSANSGTAQTFSFVFSDSQSSSNLSTAAMLFAATGAYPNSCFVIYDRNQGTVQLEWDNANGDDSAAVGSSLTLQNSQCGISATSVNTTALTLTITLSVTFQNAFSGSKNIYMYGADANGTINTGWLQMGTYAVTTVSAPVPSADSVSPSGSGGAVQDFTFVLSDSQNAANLSDAAILFASSLAYPNSCFVIYDRNEGTVQLEWDNVTGADLMPVGSSMTLQNSQCTIGASTVTTSGLSTIIILHISFKSAFSGLKNVYLYGADSDGTINTGWVQLGTWTPF